MMDAVMFVFGRRYDVFVIFVKMILLFLIMIASVLRGKAAVC